MAVSTIKSASGDYSSLTAWEAAKQGTLAAIETAECYDFSDTSSLSIDGSTTTSSFYMRIVAASGDEAAMPYSSSSYRLEPSNNHGINVLDDYVRIERIQVKIDATGTSRYGIRTLNTNTLLLGCIVQNTGTANNVGFGFFQPAGTTCWAVNCVAINTGTVGTTNGFHEAGAGASAVTRWYNCTSIGWNNGFNRSAQDAIAKNCLSHGNGTNDFNGTFASGTEYNASEDATAPGTNSRTSQTFTFVASGSNNYHLTGADAGARNFGTDLSGDSSYPFSTDFDGATRTSSWSIGAHERDLTTVTSTIKSAGGDYSSLSAWEAAKQGDLVTLDQLQQAECYGFSDGTAVDIDGSTTDSSRYMRVYAASGAEAAMPYSTSAAYRLDPGNNTNVLTINDPYVRIERIQVRMSASSFTSYGIRVPSSDAGIRVIGCIVQASNTSTGQCVAFHSSGSGDIFANCVAYNATGGAGTSIGFRSNQFSSHYFYNCLAVDCNVGFDCSGGTTLRVKNCAAYNCDTDYSGSFHSDSTNNASEDGTAPNTNEVTISADPFVDYASDNFHISSGSQLKDVGTDLSGDSIYSGTSDFDGVARSGTWDIGADEYVSSGTEATPSVGSLVLAGLAPTVTASDNKDVAPAVGALTLTGLAPTVAASGNQNVLAGLGALTLSGLAPAVVATDHQNVVAGLGALLLTGLAPTVVVASGSVDVTPSVGVLLLVGYAPSSVGAGVGGGSNRKRKKDRRAQQLQDFFDTEEQDADEPHADEPEVAVVATTPKRPKKPRTAAAVAQATPEPVEAVLPPHDPTTDIEELFLILAWKNGLL